MGGAAARRRKAPRRQGRASAASALPKEYRRPGRLQPVDGGDPRASGGAGPGPAQRSAERALDRRQLPVRPDARAISAPSEQKEKFIPGGLDGSRPRHLRPDRTATTAPTPPTWKPAQCAKCATAWQAGASTARRCGPPACTSPRIAPCSPAPAARTATRKGITCFLVPAERPASRSRSICGPSTCRPIIRASASPMSGCRTARCSARSIGGLAAGAGFRAREPHPPGRELARRRASIASTRA